jgi:hypothetical protein
MEFHGRRGRRDAGARIFIQDDMLQLVVARFWSMESTTKMSRRKIWMEKQQKVCSFSWTIALAIFCLTFATGQIDYVSNKQKIF